MRFIAAGYFLRRTPQLSCRHILPSKPIPRLCFPFQSLNKSFSSLLKNSPAHSDSHYARRLLALLLVGGRVSDNIACNDVLRAYLEAGQFSEAIHFFEHVVFELGFVPDNYTCPLVLKACSGLCSLEEGRKVRDLIRVAEFENYFKPNAYTKCALIDMFAKCGSLDDAKEVFDDMPLRERDLATWTAIICGTIHLGQAIEALCLFETMRYHGLSPDSALMAAVLPACGRLEARKMGMALQGLSLKSAFHGDLFVSNAMIDMYCKFGDMDQAYSLFCRMPCKDEVSWRTLIAGYTQNSQFSKSLELFSEMINLGVKPTGIVASILPALGELCLSEQGKAMHGFIIKKGLDCNVVVASALVGMYSTCGLTGETEILLGIWSDWDLMIWNSAIAGMASAENYGFALNIFRRCKFKPNSITLMSILPICTKLGALKQGMEVHCHVIRSSLNEVVSVSNSIIDMYCKCGYLGLGLKVFDSMVEKDIVSYNTMISACGFHGYAKQALSLFDEMKSLGIKPTKATFVGLLSACSHAGLVEEGRALYNSMIHNYGISPNMDHYSCMVDLLGRAGRIDDACSFIRTMPEEPDECVMGCLVAACRVHNMMEHVDLLGEEFLRDKFDDSGYHILMSNIYASKKRWKDASRARALIKEKGLRKKPGISWIQIGQCNHVFDARDTTHSDFSRIVEILELLVSEM